MLDEIGQESIWDHIDHEKYLSSLSDVDIWQEVIDRNGHSAILEIIGDDLEDEVIINYLSEDTVKTYLREISLEQLTEK